MGGCFDRGVYRCAEYEPHGLCDGAGCPGDPGAVVPEGANLFLSALGGGTVPAAVSGVHTGAGFAAGDAPERHECAWPDGICDGGAGLSGAAGGEAFRAWRRRRDPREAAGGDTGDHGESGAVGAVCGKRDLGAGNGRDGVLYGCVLGKASQTAAKWQAGAGTNLPASGCGNALCIWCFSNENFSAGGTGGRGGSLCSAP